jgi:hypothetical protein
VRPTVLPLALQVRLWLQLPLTLLDMGTVAAACSEYLASPAKGLAAAAAAACCALTLCYALDMRTRARFVREVAGQG